MYDSRKAGSDFEEWVANRLSEKGFWVHRMAHTKNGQPADIVASRNQRAFLIDCKDCKGNRFRQNRIEPNQHTAMRLWKETGNGNGWFCLGLRGPDGDYQAWMISYETLTKENENLSEDRIRKAGYLLEEWLLFLTIGRVME